MLNRNMRGALVQRMHYSVCEMRIIRYSIVAFAATGIGGCAAEYAGGSAYPAGYYTEPYYAEPYAAYPYGYDYAYGYYRDGFPRHDHEHERFERGEHRGFEHGEEHEEHEEHAHHDFARVAPQPRANPAPTPHAAPAPAPHAAPAPAPAPAPAAPAHAGPRGM